MCLIDFRHNLSIKTAKMKKIYLKPEIEVVELDTKMGVLAGSLQFSTANVDDLDNGEFD